MKLFKIYFNGHWPVGAVAVVLAQGAGTARKYLRDELEKRGLDHEQDLRVEEIDMRTAGAHVLLDGDY